MMALSFLNMFGGEAARASIAKAMKDSDADVPQAAEDVVKTTAPAFYVYAIRPRSRLTSMKIWTMFSSTWSDVLLDALVRAA